jgi:MFS family permease
MFMSGDDARRGNDMHATAEEHQLINRLTWRVMPILILGFVIAIIDRQNVSFAKLQMLADLGMSEAAYGLGASLFFVGYVLFEIPSVLAQQRFGARIWMARIIMGWGFVTLLITFTTSASMFYVLRFLLGAAEAGFYPGAIYYIGLWFPRAYRIRMFGLLTMGAALGNMLGSLFNGLLLDLDGALGFAGWQWVFLGSGAPAIAVALLVVAQLPSSPDTANFLSDRERRLLAEAHARNNSSDGEDKKPWWSALLDKRVVILSLIYMLLTTSFYGVTYWLPTVVHGFGVTATINGLLNMAPWILGIILLIIVPIILRNDRAVLHAAICFSLIGAIGFLASVTLHDKTVQFVALVIGGGVIIALNPIFWSVPSRFFSGTHAAASIAAINSLASLGGLFGQNLMPWVQQTTQSTATPMLIPAACLTMISLAAFLGLIFRIPRYAGDR